MIIIIMINNYFIDYSESNFKVTILFVLLLTALDDWNLS